MALEEAGQKLKAICETPRLEAEILLGHVLDKSRAYLFAHSDMALSPAQLNSFQELINQRVKGKPIAYILGYRDFWSLTLKVNEHTLIPRHETERLVELTLEFIPNQPDIRILDLGTGSGAIALALGKERPNWNITACDLSAEALLIAEENAKSLNINNVQFHHSDWFKNLPPQHYHAIVSNPPYIAEQDEHLNQGDIRFEPLNALASGQEGLADLQYIIKHGFDYLLPDGLLLLEHGYNQKQDLNATLKSAGYVNIHCWQDIQGHDRVSGGWRPKSAV